MSQLKINFRHYLATNQTILTKKWISEHSNLPSNLKSLILEATQNNNYYQPIKSTATKDPTFNRFQLLDDLEEGYPPMVVVIPSRNNSPYVSKNLQSVAFQQYPNFRIIYLDDQSTDDTVDLVKQYSHQYGIADKLKLVIMPERNRQGASRFRAYHMCDDDEIICMLDGDDWLYDIQVLSKVANQYKKGAMVTYGSYLRYHNGKLENFIYGPDENFDQSIRKTRDFRGHRWITQHLRTGYAGLFKRIRYLDLVDNHNNFLKVATDVCETMPILEMAFPHITKISSPTYVYNVDASNRHATSYFRVGEFPEQKMVRQKALRHIRVTPPYPPVSYRELFKARQLYPNYQYYSSLREAMKDIDNNNNDFTVIGEISQIDKTYNLDYLVKILDACELPLLVIDKNLNNPRYVFSDKISIGQTSRLLINDGAFSILATDLLNHLSSKKKFDYTGYLLSIVN